MLTYEQRLNASLRWALEEGGLHFQRKSAVHKTLERIARGLDELGIPYAVIGAMSMFFHGYRRFTEGVDLLVMPEDLRTIHERLEGLGYVPPFTGSKHLRDAETGVRVEFLTSGDYPGDGRPKPVAFPHPAEASVEVDGYRCVRLPGLIELKLASGMTNPIRLKDISDVLDIIRVLGLPRELGDELNPYVREKYWELWDAVANNPSEP